MTEYREVLVQRDVPEWAHETWRVRVPADTPDEDLVYAANDAIVNGDLINGVESATWLGSDEHSEMYGPDSYIRRITTPEGDDVAPEHWER